MGNGKEQVSGSVAFLIKYEQEFNSANDKIKAMEYTWCQNLYGDQRAQQPAADEVQWTRPPLGVAKLNLLPDWVQVELLGGTVRGRC